MAPAATETARQLLDRKTQQFIRRKLLKPPKHIRLPPRRANSLTSSRPELLGQDRRGDTQQLAPMAEIKLRRNLSKQPVALLGHRAWCWIKLEAIQVLNHVIQQRELLCGEERKQVFQRQGKAPEDHPADFRSTNPATPSPARNQNISRSKPLGRPPANVFPASLLRKHQKKALSFMRPFRRRF